MRNMYKVGKCLLLDLLKARGLSQTDLAIELGVSKQRINAIAHNRRTMSLETAINVANALKCDVTDLYEITEVSNE